MARCSNRYSLPLKSKDIAAHYSKASPAHVGILRHAIDFECDEGTPVYAALGGTVVFVNDNFRVGGPYKKYWSCGNRIVIRHRNGEYTAYEHFQYRSALVCVGQKVRRGQKIGLSGNTGYSFGPHVHFEVFNNPNKKESEGTTLQIMFRP